ncbi:hypothetical protein [Telmatospirillum sp. J64-1]|uniref:hypothetical protein n=1 Tax=Telmatospirillum sp. J64-1 TaxID=2502183 RepID=UPI00115F58A7|nr:hypothetical protein [Telmatospirillum sp. J64-1]
MFDTGDLNYGNAGLILAVSMYGAGLLALLVFKLTGRSGRMKLIGDRIGTTLTVIAIGVPTLAGLLGLLSIILTLFGIRL